jgi:hypothetical protein
MLLFENTYLDRNYWELIIYILWIQINNCENHKADSQKKMCKLKYCKANQLNPLIIKFSDKLVCILIYYITQKSTEAHP